MNEKSNNSPIEQEKYEAINTIADVKRSPQPAPGACAGLILPVLSCYLSSQQVMN